MPSNMYSPTSSLPSSNFDRHHTIQNTIHLSPIDQSPYHQNQYHLNNQQVGECTKQCLRFRYFTVFLLSTVCLVSLCASLGTHKWVISRPMRILKLNNSLTNWTSLMLIAKQNDNPSQSQSNSNIRTNLLSMNELSTTDQSTSTNYLFSGPTLVDGVEKQFLSNGHNNKFQGEIYFGLFRGLKILNHGFGDRQTIISVSAPFIRQNNLILNNSSNNAINNSQNAQELVNFKFWLLTLTSISLAILFALIGSIFAIINFVITPRGTLTGPIGLVIWNATSCFACCVGAIAWLAEFFLHLQTNVLTQEELQNGWTSEGRSQLGYSYYLVVTALTLHLVNIFIVSIVQLDTWGKKKSSNRPTRPVCEGVTMLY